MQCACALLQAVTQEGEINHPVRVFPKAGAAVVASLDDVESYAWEDQACKSRHSRSASRGAAR